MSNFVIAGITLGSALVFFIIAGFEPIDGNLDIYLGACYGAIFNGAVVFVWNSVVKLKRWKDGT